MTWMYLVFGFLGLAMFLPTIDMEISNDIADINGDDQDNRLSGSEISDTIRGGDGDDTLIGQAWNDYLYSEQGNDTLDGGADADTLYGGVGADNLTGGAADDRLFGEEGDNELYSDNAPDSALTGGNDLICGEEGNDKLYGGALGGSAADILYGGTGEDTLIGGDGADILYGGDGNDTFLMQGQDSVIGGDGGDNFRTGGWYDANSALLKTGNNDYTTIEDFSLSGNKSDFLIVEVPFDATGTFELEAVENPAGSGLYDLRLIKDGTEATVVAKVTNGGADLRVDDNLRIVKI